MRNLCLTLALVSLSLGGLVASAQGPVVLELDQPQTAGISAFRAMWDTPVVTAADGVRVITDDVIKDRGGAAPWAPQARKDGALPGALAFDALRRSLLVRFPDAAEKIAARLNQGYALQKVELVLPFRDEELWPDGSSSGAPPEGGYEYRANWGTDALYRQHRPTWHALAWALRRPWQADPQTGPTFNAFLNGAGYWKKYGAADPEADRFPLQFGPTPVHYQSLEGRMEVTAALTDPTFGPTLGARLRQLADCGFLVRKWETYDHRYFTGCYEWATATGGRAIIIDSPKLVVTFQPAPGAPQVALPPAPDLAALAASLRQNGQGGKPTAVMPTEAELQDLARRYAPTQPAWMPDWQWERVKTLLTVQQGQEALTEPFWVQFAPRYLVDRRLGGNGSTPTRSRAQIAYEVWVDSLLGGQPRGWNGFEASAVLLPALVYRDTLPGPVRDTFDEYWTAWLMPDRPTAPLAQHLNPALLDGSLVHPMVDQLSQVPATTSFSGGDTYFNKTGDWRGNKSFYRSGFNYVISTMNFNHSAAMGALLGGALINSELAMADGRHGVENFPLRLWCWYDGTTQESIDHYYLSITLTAQKMIADFGPTHYDRMLGKSILLKTMDELASAFHPGLRRFIAGSGRTSPNHVLVSQDGVYHIVHTLSKQGALRDLDNPEIPGHMPAIGQELAPAQVGRQTLQGPWAPEWTSAVVDDKPLPWEMTCSFKQWGTHDQIPIMRRSYLGKHYGLYSADVSSGVIPILGQWRRTDRLVERMQEVGTMLMRYGLNTTRLVNDAPGWIATYGQQSTLQHHGKMIVVTSPNQWFDVQRDIKSLQSTIALYNYETPQPSWRVFVDGQPIRGLPLSVKASQRITIKDGVSYLGVIPLPGTDLGRSEEVRLSAGDAQEFENKTYQAALVIDNYNLKQEARLGADTDFGKLDRAWGGFVVEMADATEYPSFEAFQQHIASARLETRYEPEQALAHVKYVSGKDALELGVYTTYQEGQTLDKCFAYRRVNGAWPYLPPGVERETPVALQATTGWLEKNGARLVCEKGTMAYLQAYPAADAYAGYNPLPDPTYWQFSLPGGRSVRADGKLGLIHLVVRPRENEVRVSYATRPGSDSPDLATALLLEGFPKPPTVILDDQRLTQVATLTTAGRLGYLVPLQGELSPQELEALPARLEAAAKAVGRLVLRHEVTTNRVNPRAD